VKIRTTFARGLRTCVTVKHREQCVVCGLGNSKPAFENRDKRGEGWR
jgi:hypothetical protein